MATQESKSGIGYSPAANQALSGNDRLYLFIFYSGVLLSTLISSQSINFTPDAYYYFAIARNFVDGHGVTFDGTSITTGFHPLWLGVSVLVFSLFSDLGSFHQAILLTQTLLFIAGHWLLVRTAKVNGISVDVFIFLSIPLYLVNLTVFQSGVENTLLFYLLALFIWLQYRPAGGTGLNQVFITLTLILIYFTRIDSIFLLALYGLWLLWSRWKQGDLWNGMIHCGLLGIAVLGHWIFMYTRFGTIYPTSSLAIQVFLAGPESDNFLQALSPFGHILTTRLLEIIGSVDSYGGWRRYIGLAVPASLLLFFYVIIRDSARFRLPIILIGAMAIIQFLYYAALLNGWMRPWYFTGWFIVTSFGTAFIIRDHILPRLPRIPAGATAALLALSVSVILYANSNRTNVPWDVHAQESQLLVEYQNAGAVLVGWSPDRATFFSDVGIHHLEGLVNGYDFVNNYLPGRIASYIRDIGATHFVISNPPVLPEQMPPYIFIVADSDGKLEAYGRLDRRNSYIAVYEITFDRASIPIDILSGGYYRNALE